MGFNCNHGQFLNMNKEWIRWCWGKFCLLCVLILCGFPFRLPQCEDKEGDFINYPKSLPLLFSSFFFMSVSFSHRFPSSVVDLSELCPIHLWQWLCLWYKQSISFTHTVRNLGCCVLFFFSVSLCGDLLYVYPIPLPQRDWSLKTVIWMEKWLSCWVGKYEFILTTANPFTMTINMFMLWLPWIPWATS